MNKKKLIVIWIMINLIFVLATIHIITSDQKQLYGLGTSMQHSDTRQLEVFDNADGIIFESVERDWTLHTYYDPMTTDHQVAGDHGDVIIFESNGRRYVHRLVCYVIQNQTAPLITVDIPELNIYNQSEVKFISYGFNNYDFSVNFTRLFDLSSDHENPNTRGYLTKGDSVDNVDQLTLGIPLVDVSNIEGRVISVGDNDLFPNNILEFCIYIGVFVSLLAIYRLRYLGVELGKRDLNLMFISIWASIIIIKVGLTMSASSIPANILVASSLFLIGLVIAIYILFRKANNNFGTRKVMGLFALFLIPYSVTLLIPIEFIYSVNAIILLSIVLSLDPAGFLNIQKPEIKTEWLMFLSFASVIFFISIIIPFPVYLIFMVGVIGGNVWCYWGWGGGTHESSGINIL